MALTAPVRLTVGDVSQVAPVRRAAESLAAGLGWDETRRGEAAIVATELATNVFRHGGGGEMVLRAGGDAGGLDLLAWDRGPGMTDVVHSMRDGESTAGSAGTGLGAVHRLAGHVDLHTGAGSGTVVLARLGPAAAAGPPRVDGLALALAGEEASGDAWTFAVDGEETALVLADGLGHGPEAARAAGAALRELDPGRAPEDALARMHEALRPTRGAAAAVALHHAPTGALRFAGVGNISATIVDGPKQRSLASMSGTLGHRVARITPFDHELPPSGLLVLHSDGLRTGWELARYPGLVRRDPLVIAGVLLRDFERGRDDVSVVVARPAGAR